MLQAASQPPARTAATARQCSHRIAHLVRGVAWAAPHRHSCSAGRDYDARSSRRQAGRETEVIVDGSDPEVPNHWLARSHADAPDIDGVVRVKGKGLKAGDLVRVKITAADGYDLTARAIGPGR